MGRNGPSIHMRTQSAVHLNLQGPHLSSPLLQHVDTRMDASPSCLQLSTTPPQGTTYIPATSCPSGHGSPAAAIALALVRIGYIKSRNHRPKPLSMGCFS